MSDESETNLFNPLNIDRLPIPTKEWIFPKLTMSTLQLTVLLKQS